MPPVECEGGHSARGALFVYYKVAQERAGKLQQAFEKAAADPFPAFPGLCRIELMRRSHHTSSSSPRPGEFETWMEIYWYDRGPGADPHADPVPSPRPDLQALQQAIESRALEAGIVGLIEGPRHYEAFDACA